MIEEVIVNGALEKATGKEAITNGIADTPMKRKANIPAEGDSQERRVKRLVDVDAGESASAAGRECKFTSFTYIRFTFWFPHCVQFTSKPL